MLQLGIVYVHDSFFKPLSVILINFYLLEKAPEDTGNVKPTGPGFLDRIKNIPNGKRMHDLDRTSQIRTFEAF